jgi:hypothetical protein
VLSDRYGLATFNELREPILGIEDPDGFHNSSLSFQP